ncbi:sodium:solute symporter family protein [Candidatus Thiothrix sp. Deng01]|uniref:Sodium:solute symporter family protein n=1 Tax=Candidatus Thiothrix phosphatis TaxID=3112415 RepID=A0ABU6CYE4_9GAMM|nr:sodium:solute symporter family protein [Candidatus Thiothrix sp. Deng01]MEB4591124.1 sodium:solute symporter family protein [Candidatus Thiothrix sp. Deng01]
MTELQIWTYVVVGLSFALYFGIAIWARAGSTGEFYVAGGGIHPVANGMATAADWMSAASFISMAGIIAFKGYDASAYLMGWTGGYVLMAMLLAPYLRKFGKFTVPEFIGDRYYSNTARIVGVICLIVISLTYVIGQMKGVGVTFSRFLEVSVDTGLYIGMAIVFVYAVLGGMKGITYTQIAQYVVLIFAYTVPAIFISMNLTGNPIPQLGLGSTMVDGSGVYLLDKLDQVVTDLGFKAYTTPNAPMINTFLLTMTLMIGTAGLPHVIIRFFTVPKVRDARSSAGWALVFIALLYTTAPAVGAMARMNLMNTVQTGEIGSPDGNLKFDERPRWMKTWEETKLLAMADKNGDGKIQYYSDGGLADAQAALAAAEKDGGDVAAAQAKVDEAMKKNDESKFGGFGWKGNEVTKVDNDIMVLANPEIAQLPNWVIALVAAGGIAAALSTAAGLLLAISSSISHDLLKSIFMPGISEKNELMASRIVMTVAILVAGYMGLNPPGFAAQVVALAFGLAAASIFPVLMMGIFSKRVNSQGAIAGMVAGIIVTMLYIFMYKGWFFVKGTNMLPDKPDAWILGISPEAFGTVGALVNFAVAWAVSRVTPPPPEHIQHLVEDVRVPRGAGVATGH